MKHCLGALPAALPLLALATECVAERFEGKGVEASLLSEVTVIAPGQTFTVALTLSHQPGFHTYWKNPGTVGMPTDIRWELPKGFKAGELAWQVPERSKMFKYDVYGYETNATLLTEISAPPDLPPEPVLLQAKASWMACSDTTCNPGYHTFELRLPVAKETVWVPRIKKLVAEARSSIPKPFGDLRAKAKSKGKKVRLQVEGKPLDDLPDAANLHFFSRLNHYQVDPSQKIRFKRNTLILTLTKADYAPDKIDRVEGILRFPETWAGSKELPYAFIQAKLD